ncbi:saccharopine dehydrogenase family protein [Rhodococcus erythropolis]|uniref:saccharopine dehydrogenase family protein n=1 Tax=Rhodococcus erythropolis TaxID=1833 RepID=UPI00038E652C|nr:saccharopine dehydrogenase NADP-binding domain-containing protein [Rhodococcus erythropolis]EQM31478.1 saccharopine dehydrogenase [Rhodococcus erythropolis DN1]
MADGITVVALGGAGAMGSAAVRLAATLPGIGKVVVADRDIDAAKRLSVELAQASAEVEARSIDVTDGRTLRELLDGADVVVNTVGPFFRFGVGIHQAAIETGTHYLDICDDWEPAVDMLELDCAARGAGICAVVGMGASPGMSNLLAAMAVSRLDVVDDLYTAWPVDVEGEDESVDTLSAAAVHWMQQISGTVPVVRAGRIVNEEPLRSIALELPGGRRGNAYVVGHPEPVMFHRTINPAGHSANLMVITPETVAFLDVLRSDIDKGRIDLDSAAEELGKPSLRRMIRAAPRMLTRAGHGSLPLFFASATGVREGREMRVVARIADDSPVSELLSDMAGATGIPLALGLAQVVSRLADGTIRDRVGVHSAESVIDPDVLFTALARLFGRTDWSDIVTVESEFR